MKHPSHLLWFLDKTSEDISWVWHFGQAFRRQRTGSWKRDVLQHLWRKLPSDIKSNAKVSQLSWQGTWIEDKTEGGWNRPLGGWVSGGRKKSRNEQVSKERGSGPFHVKEESDKSYQWLQFGSLFIKKKSCRWATCTWIFDKSKERLSTQNICTANIPGNITVVCLYFASIEAHSKSVFVTSPFWDAQGHKHARQYQNLGGLAVCIIQTLSDSFRRITCHKHVTSHKYVTGHISQVMYMSYSQTCQTSQAQKAAIWRWASIFHSFNVFKGCTAWLPNTDKQRSITNILGCFCYQSGRYFLLLKFWKFSFKLSILYLLTTLPTFFFSVSWCPPLAGNCFKCSA